MTVTLGHSGVCVCVCVCVCVTNVMMWVKVGSGNGNDGPRPTLFFYFDSSVTESTPQTHWPRTAENFGSDWWDALEAHW